MSSGIFAIGSLVIFAFLAPSVLQSTFFFEIEEIITVMEFENMFLISTDFYDFIFPFPPKV